MLLTDKVNEMLADQSIALVAMAGQSIALVANVYATRWQVAGETKESMEVIDTLFRSSG